jgi:nucleoside-diphosphate-sugar epimerase
VIILGLGFTGRRVAERLLLRGLRPCAVARRIERFSDLERAGLLLAEWNSERQSVFPHLPRKDVLVHTVPPLGEPENSALRALIRDLDPRRIVYISSTNVYGGHIDVNEETPVQPTDERSVRRMDEERWIGAGPWSSVILRSAAIYGPGRGVHATLREGRIPRSAGSGVVSRIHVDDLAAMIEAGASSAIEGAWPVADDQPCPTAEIAAWCARTMNLRVPVELASAISIEGRRVDARKIRALLGVDLKFPGWETGVPASIAEENRRLS